MMNEKPVILILGASSDIGMFYIKKNHSKYKKILAQYRTLSNEFQSIIDSYPDIVIPFQADFMNLGDVWSLLTYIRENELYPEHIIHLPAAKYQNVRFIKTQWSDYENEIFISLRSIVLLLKECIPIMSKKRYGKIVIVLSSAIINTPPKFCTPYILTKYALLGLVKELSTEYSAKGITINGVSPSMVETKFLSDIPELVLEENALNSPIGRNLLPSDVASTIEFLLSEGADCITGVNIPVTGGN